MQVNTIVGNNKASCMVLETTVSFNPNIAAHVIPSNNPKITLKTRRNCEIRIGFLKRLR